MIRRSENMTDASVDRQPGPEQILQVGFGFWSSKVLLSAIELELFAELGKQLQLDRAEKNFGGPESESYLQYLFRTRLPVHRCVSHVFAPSNHAILALPVETTGTNTLTFYT